MSMHSPSPSHRCLFIPLLLQRCLRLHCLGAALATAFLLLILVTGSALAQLVPQRQWVVFRQTDGLLSSDIYSVLVDGDAVWFGGSKGVNRFDGQWQSFPISLIGSELNAQHNRSELPASPGIVTALAKAGRGSGIWLGTSNGYVALWDGTKWQLAATLGSTINDIADIEGILWLATDDGLYLYSSGSIRPAPALSGQAVYKIAVVNNTVWLGSDRGLWQLSLAATDAQQTPVSLFDATQLDALGITDLADADPALAVPLAGPIQALWSDGAGSIWLGAGSIVAQFNPQLALGRSFEPFAEEGHSVTITAITGTPGERIWIASEGAGVVQYMFADGQLAAANNLGSSSDGGLDTDTVRALAIDHSNTLWFASPVGVFRYQWWAWLESDPRLDGLVVNDLLYDQKGALWVATGGEGVQQRTSLYAPPISFYPSEEGLPSEFVNVLEQDAQGNIWAGTAEGLAQYADGAWSAPLGSTHLPSPTVKALQADAAGLWIGTTGGLAYYTPTDGALHVEPLFAGKPVARLALDGLGRLWVASQNDGLQLRSADGGWQAVPRPESGGAPASQVTALLPDPEALGAMYAAFLDTGIYRWTGEAWENVDRRHWMRGDYIYALALDQVTDSLWIGSEIGLSRLDVLSLVTYDSHAGMQNGAIRAMAAAEDGGYWFGGQKGLSFYKQEVTPPWISLQGTSSPGLVNSLDSVQVYAGRTIQVVFTVGDMQSLPQELAVFYRLNRHGVANPWREVINSPLALRVETPDTVDLELMVRDQSFNYSPPLLKRLAVIAPPATVALPLLGEVEDRIFQLLLVFGGLAFLGFGYVSFEIFLHNHHVNEAIRRGYNPYISGEPVRQAEMFFGRHELLQRIVATLHNNSIMIHGERRIGKTTLLYQLTNALRHIQDDEYWFVPVLVDLEGTPEEGLFLQLGEEIYQTVLSLPDLPLVSVQRLQFLTCHRYVDRSAPEAGTPQYTDREFSRDLRFMLRLLKNYAEQQQNGRQLRLILLLDEVDTLSQFNHIYQQQLRRIFMRDFAATLGAVVAGIAISKEWDRVESPWYNLFNEIAMAPFSDAEAIELLVEPVRGFYIFEPAALEFIVSNSDGRPYRLQQYALEAVNHMLEHKRRRIRLADAVFAHTQILATMIERPQDAAHPDFRPSEQRQAVASDAAPTQLGCRAEALGFVEGSNC